MVLTLLCVNVPAFASMSQRSLPTSQNSSPLRNGFTVTGSIFDLCGRSDLDPKARVFIPERHRNVPVSTERQPNNCPVVGCREGHLCWEHQPSTTRLMCTVVGCGRLRRVLFQHTDHFGNPIGRPVVEILPPLPCTHKQTVQ